MSLLLFAVAVGAIVYCLAVLSWPLVVKPALRRRFERRHHRRKAGRS